MAQSVTLEQKRSHLSSSVAELAQAQTADAPTAVRVLRPRDSVSVFGASRCAFACLVWLDLLLLICWLFQIPEMFQEDGRMASCLWRNYLLSHVARDLASFGMT
jgi:hypothetical protein